jgi:hypothetical protein
VFNVFCIFRINECKIKWWLVAGLVLKGSIRKIFVKSNLIILFWKQIKIKALSVKEIYWYRYVQDNLKSKNCFTQTLLKAWILQASAQSMAKCITLNKRQILWLIWLIDHLITKNFSGGKAR